MTIPASLLVNIQPSVLSAGGTSLQLNGLELTNGTRTPIGSVLSFPNAVSVGAYYGVASQEAVSAAIYFAGYINCTQLPTALLMAQYNQSAVPPWLRGGNVSGVPLTTFQGYSGTISVTVNGTQRNATQNFAAATSFSNGAALLQTTFNSFDAVTTATIAAAAAVSFTGSITGNVLTVTAVSSGSIAVGGTLSGTGGGGIPAGCAIVSQLTGTGGTGTYLVSTTQNVSSTTITEAYGVLNISGVTSGIVAIGQILNGTGVLGGTGIYVSAQLTGTGGTGTYALSGGATTGTMSSSTVNLGQLLVAYDSQAGAFVITGGTPGPLGTITQASGALSVSLLMTTALGAVTSQGVAAAVPSTFMTAFTQITQNWATFYTTFNPDVFGNANKLLFAAWVNSTLSGAAARYAYAAWDTDVTPTLSTQATTSLGYLLGPNGSNSNGTVPIYDPTNMGLAPFFSGMVAATNFFAQNGRITHAFKGQTGLTTNVTSGTVAANLIANNYNFYGQYATANQNFNLYQNGSITGPFQWSDSYVNQIWLNNSLQLALMNFLANINSVPYTQDGYAMVAAVIGGVMVQAIFNGVVSQGVPLTAGQIAAVQQAVQQGGGSANNNAAAILQTRGWYLQITPAAGTVRAARTSPPCTLWYTDGGSIQQINLASIEVQ